MLDDAGPMQRFVADLLEQEGAVVEPIEPEGLEVLAPHPVQQALGVPELCRLAFGTAVPANAQRIGMESDWLERFDRLLGDQGRWNRVVMGSPVRLSDPDSALANELALDNATYRLLGSQSAWTRYLLLDFRYTALSDEKRDGLLQLGINLATGALPDVVLGRVAPWLGDPPDEPDLPPDAALPPDWERGRLLSTLRRALPSRLDTVLEPFRRGLRRRLERDADRLHNYHNDLYREAMRRSVGLAPTDADFAREQLRVAAISREYRAKLDDLGHKYALRVTLNWVRTLELVMPVQRLDVQIRRRKSERLIQLDWNPMARRLEGPPCEDTLAVERPRLACDDAVHLVSQTGLSGCAGCGKTYCRACHPAACPKCGYKEGGCSADTDGV
jgi:hypothetical protein